MLFKNFKNVFSLVLNLYIDENNLQPGQQVLFLSFSRAAVSRISQSADLVVSRDDFQDFLAIQTFHSFFWEIIKTHGYLLGIPKKLTIFSPHYSLFWIRILEDLDLHQGN